jgi:serine/threonine protein kinase
VGIGPGTRLENFELIARLASGGMGEVWLARDLQLHRKVALKLLPLHLSEDSDRITRLRQEARTASALNHPNVCTIHALGSAADGRVFIAMEFVEGSTLRQRLAGGPTTIRQALDITSQIASALAAAHDAGVIHRDVKPENVMIRADGLVKVLDFGLARFEATAPGGHTTRTALARDDVAGTITYMSPEQARGEPLDRRSDIFSLGAVLYEMVTGRQAFAGTTTAIVYEAILNRMPIPPVRATSDVPARLGDIINRCLEKDATLRYQTASDLRTDVMRLQRDSERHTDPANGRDIAAQRSSVQPHRYRRAVAAIAVLLSMFGAAVLGTSIFRSRRNELQEVQLTTNSSEAPVSAAAISPDGRYLAYADDGGIHVRLIDSRETHTLSVPNIGTINRLAWFPDGGKLLVSADAVPPAKTPSIWSVSLIGGSSRKLHDDGIEGFVAPDGARITFVDSSRTGVWMMGPAGEDPYRVVTVNAGEELHQPGFWLNGSRHVYGHVRSLPDKSGDLMMNVSLEARDPDGHTDVLISDPGLRGAVRLPDGRLIYSLVAQPILNRGGSSLWEAETDPRSGVPRGKPRQIGTSPDGALVGFSASADGRRIAFVKRSLQHDVYIADLPLSLPLSARRLTLDDSDDFATNWTPDSKAVLFTSDRNGTRDIFKQGLDQRAPEAIVTGPDDDSGPTAVTPDGAWYYYLVNTRGWTSTFLRRTTIMRIAAAGGPPQRVRDGSPWQFVLCAQPPSQTCVFVDREGTRYDIYALDPIHGKGRRMASTDLGSEPYAAAAISPDGSRVAIMMASGRRLRIVSLRGDPDRDVTIHDRPLVVNAFYWSADGAGCYLSSPSGATTGTDLLHVDLDGHVTVIWHQPESSLMMSAIPSPDGRHLALTRASAISNVWMIKRF